MSTATLPRLLVLCPSCGDPVDGLLAGCDKPRCKQAEIAEDIAFERNQDR